MDRGASQRDFFLGKMPQRLKVRLLWHPPVAIQICRRSTENMGTGFLWTGSWYGPAYVNFAKKGMEYIRASRSAGRAPPPFGAPDQNRIGKLNERSPSSSESLSM
jgi:hypothetical protein